MSAEVHNLPIRMPTAELSADMSAALATRRLIDMVGALVNLPRDQQAALVPEQLETLASVLQTAARTVRLLADLDKGRAK